MGDEIKHIDSPELSSDDFDNEEVNEDLSIPLDIHIGFYSNVNLKQVKSHVLSYAEKNFNSLNDVYYQIKKFEDGFLFEIHQGGSQRGYLSDYIENNYDDALIVTSGNIYRASDSIHGGIRLVKLTDEDVRAVSSNPENFEILEARDKLTKLKATGFGFFVFASVLFVVSVLSIGISASVKYLVLDKTDAIYFTNIGKTYPHEFIAKIQNEMYQMDLSSEFFKSFTYDSSKKEGEQWKVEKGSILNNVNSFQDNSEVVEPDEKGTNGDAKGE
jgi:hypothetical protein